MVRGTVTLDEAVALDVAGLVVAAMGPHFEHILQDVAVAFSSLQNTGGATLLDCGAMLAM